MKIACLQFAPKLGNLESNIAQANAILLQQPLEDLDLLVLPELALTGKPTPCFEKGPRPTTVRLQLSLACRNNTLP